MERSKESPAREHKSESSSTVLHVRFLIVNLFLYFRVTAEVVRAFKLYNEGLSLSNGNQQRLRHLLDLKNTSEGMKAPTVTMSEMTIRQVE